LAAAIHAQPYPGGGDAAVAMAYTCGRGCKLNDHEPAWTERSFTAMFVYALKRGLNHDFLQESGARRAIEKPGNRCPG
jgi:hypothetical protein